MAKISYWPLSLEMGMNMEVVPLVVQGPLVTLWCPLPALGELSWSSAHTHTGCRMRASSLLSA